ncbi:MAG: helix-turn-helix transcriptional regulator [Candidatus Limnocylindrales bacterium]
MDLGRVGRAVRVLRVRRGWRQADLAERAGMARSVVGRIERGEQAGLSLDDVASVALALGATLDLQVRWQGEGLDRLLDEGHARLVEAVVRELAALGWDVAVEVSFAGGGERGSIDVLAFHPVQRALVVIEVKSVTPDVQAMLMGLDRKGRIGATLARDRGWDARVVARVLVLWDTRTNRRRLDQVASTIAVALPGGTREVRRWLAEPAGAAVSGVWFVPHVHGLDGTGIRRHRVRVRGDASGTSPAPAPAGSPAPPARRPDPPRGP